MPEAALVALFFCLPSNLLVSSSNPSVAPLWCDLGFVPNSSGNKAAANLRPNLAVQGTHL